MDFGRQKRTAVFALIGALVCSTAIGALQMAVAYVERLPRFFYQESPGKKYLPLRPFLPARHDISFLSQKTGVPYYRDLQQAQYVLAPALIEEGNAADWVIASDFTPAEISAIQKKAGLRVAQKFPDAVWLLRKDVR